MMRHVHQEHPYGCVIACMAMILGRSYKDVCDDVGYTERGSSYHLWQDHLGLNGYAFQIFFLFDQKTNKPRTKWPLDPWADVHLCAVDAGRGPGSHQIVLLRDGSVLDPDTAVPKRISDYSGISYMAAVFLVGTGPIESGEKADG